VLGAALRLGLEADLVEYDLAALRAHPDHPGEEAPRSELANVLVRVPARGGGGPRLALCAHVDVVGPGAAPWARDPWSGAIENGFVHGRGAADMKGALVAALHALAGLSGANAEVVLLVVSSEEDGGLGTFAALEDDDRFDACIVLEPTGFDVVCAQAGALTFTGVVEGVSAHAANRLAGVSAIDRYLPVHAALAEHERRLNEDVSDPLMRRLELPYPLVVGRVQSGEWSSQVPDRLVFEGRAPVRVGEDPAAARAGVEAAVAPVPLAWTGGQFASARTDPEDPFAVLVREAVGEELGRPARVTGVSWGADMRLFCARGIPTVMVGTGGMERAHAVDERVAVADLEALMRILVRVGGAFGGNG
jgi:acetylornithine deacetylase